MTWDLGPLKKKKKRSLPLYSCPFLSIKIVINHLWAWKLIYNSYIVVKYFWIKSSINLRVIKCFPSDENKEIIKLWIEFGTTRCDIFWFWFLNVLTITTLWSLLFSTGLYYYTCCYISFVYSHIVSIALSLPEPWYQGRCQLQLRIITAPEQLTKCCWWSKSGWKHKGLCTQQHYDSSWVCLILMRHKWWICPDSLASSR